MIIFLLFQPAEQIPLFLFDRPRSDQEPFSGKCETGPAERRFNFSVQWGTPSLTYRVNLHVSVSFICRTAQIIIGFQLIFQAVSFEAKQSFMTLDDSHRCELIPLRVWLSNMAVLDKEVVSSSIARGFLICESGRVGPFLP
jgi:hypothetical protein